MVVAPTPPTKPSTASPNGTWHLLTYVIVSAVYLFYDYARNSNNDVVANAPPKSKWASAAFVFSIWVIQFGMTFALLTQQCKYSPNYWLAVWASFAMWIVLFVPTFVCLEYMYTWLQPFANTIGYLINKMNGLASFMNDILKGRDNRDKIQKYLDYMRKDPWALFSMLTTSEYAPDVVRAGAKFEELKTDYLRFTPGMPEEKAKQTFVSYVYAKESMAKFVFYILTLNLMTDLTAIIALENSPCATNLDELSNAPPPKTAATTATKPPATIYKTSE